MKANVFVATLLLVCLGCSSQQGDQLTQQQNDQIKNEVRAVGDSIVAKWERMDVQGAVDYYAPEMFAIGDSATMDYPTYKKGWIDFPNVFSAVKWTTKQWEIKVLSKDLAMSAAIGRLEMTMKSGDVMVINPEIYTDIYKKLGNQWKVIYEHSSGIPVTQKANKK